MLLYDDGSWLGQSIWPISVEDEITGRRILVPRTVLTSLTAAGLDAVPFSTATVELRQSRDHRATTHESLSRSVLEYQEETEQSTRD